jgi:hypothetical protein
MRDDVAHPPRTSVPQWDSTPPALNPTATAYTLFSVDSHLGTAQRWSDELSAARVEHVTIAVDGRSLPGWLDGCGALLEALAAHRHVGWRVAAAGDEVGVLSVAAAARRAGLIDAEITTFAESRRRCVVYCAHCKTTMLADTGPGAVVDCRGCRRTLDVRPHVSRLAGTYLGVAAR